MTARDVVILSIVVFALAIGFFITYGIINTAYNRFISNTVVAASPQAVHALEGGQRVTERMDYVVFAFFLAFILGIMVTGWFIGGHPIFMFVYFLFIIITVVLSIFFSNTWETVSQMAVFGSDISHFPLTNNIMLQLPIYMAVVGMLGMVVMFAKPSLDGENL